MSVPLPSKVTSLTVTNSLNVAELWADSIYDKRIKGGNILVEIRDTVKKLKELE